MYPRASAALRGVIAATLHGGFMSQGRRDHNSSSIATIAATDCERDLTEDKRGGRTSAFETYLALV